MTLFYIENATKAISVLPQEESKHAVKVLRLKVGSKLAITNGTGSFFEAEITFEHPKKCEIVVTKEEVAPPQKHRIHMAVAPTKLNDRFEWMLEKMTEIGVDEITPIICHHSERKSIKHERMERIIISAVKQSWKAHKPILHEAVSFSEFIQKNTFSQQYIAHCNGGCGADQHLIHTAKPGDEVAVLIGPEGDFSPQEVALATQNKWVKIGLGSARLRTETAAVAACHTLNLIQEVKSQ